MHTYRPTYDRSTGEDSVSILEEVLPEVVRGSIIPAGGVIHVTLMGLGPAVQVNVYEVMAPNVAGDEGPPVMSTLMDWEPAA